LILSEVKGIFMNQIIKDINKAIDEVKGFLESSIIPLDLDGTTYFAFPHYKGKERATEFGGTSSALAAYRLVNRTEEIDHRIDGSKLWLYKRQKNGAWQSKGIYCSHVTAGVLCDLYGYNLNNNVLQSAIDYIISCYNREKGYFYSYVSDENSPKIYVTYICLKALMLYKSIDNIDLDKIKSWIEKSHNLDGKWGISPGDGFSSLTHTIYALRILFMCGVSKREINKRYCAQINWLKKENTTLYKKYDLEEVVQQNSVDNDGVVYKEVTFQHSCITEVGMFWLDFKSLIYSTTIAREILSYQYNGGWGIAHNRLTMWETEKNVQFLADFKTKYLESSYISKLLCNITYYFSLKDILFFLSIGIVLIAFFWIIKQPDRIDGLIISLLSSTILAIIGNVIDNT